MSWLVTKLLLVVLVTHGVRVAGTLVGPRWSGLLLGLPSTTALVLFCLARRQGLVFATLAAESSLLGLAAAVVLALAFALAAGRGWRLPGLLLLAVAGYFLVAGAFWGAGPLDLPRALLAGAAAITLGCLATGRRPRGGAPATSARSALPWPLALGLRTAIPVGCVLAVTHLAEALGAQGAGLLSTFPSTLLAVLVVTYLEDGREAAARTARAFPQGQFSTLAYLLLFQLAGPSIGLGGGICLGYAAALLTLFAVEGVCRRALPAPAILTDRGGGIGKRAELPRLATA